MKDMMEIRRAVLETLATARDGAEEVVGREEPLRLRVRDGEGT